MSETGTKMAQSSKGEGNGNTGLTKRKRAFLFTYNNYLEPEVERLHRIFSEACVEHVLQEEIGTNGTKHIQGYVYFQNARTIRKLPDLVDTNKIHWEHVRSIRHARQYCMKKETRAGEIASNNVKEEVRDPLEGLELHDWQRDILALLTKEPDRRTINWFIDKEGAKGKTSLAIHICLNNPFALYLSGKANDCKFAIASHLKKKVKLEVVIFDFVRTSEKYISYEAIESIKNGIFFSGKYESSMCVFNIPHVIALSNFDPDLDALSLDRWNITQL